MFLKKNIIVFFLFFFCIWYRLKASNDVINWNILRTMILNNTVIDNISWRIECNKHIGIKNQNKHLISTAEIR